MEAQILGSMLIDPAAAERAVAALTPEDFYRGAHRVIFQAARALVIETHSLDEALLRQRLADAGKLDEVGGVVYFGELAGKVASSAHIDQYIGLVRERALARSVIDITTQLSRDGYDPGRRAVDLLASARTRLEELERSTAVGLDIVAPRMSSCFSRLEALKQGPPEWLLRPAGFDALMDLMPGGGLWPGLYVLGGPPSVGKTTFVMQLLESVMIANPETPALYVSCEMTLDDLVRSCVCRLGEIDQIRLLRGQLEASEWGRFDHALVEVSNRLHHVRCSRDIRVPSLRALVRQTRPRIVIVDYFQMLQPDGDFLQAKDRIDAVACELLALRDECVTVPVIVLASHNRGDAKRPYAPGRGYGAYKETGNIEYNADRCLNLEYSDQEYDRSRNGSMGAVRDLNLVLLKNRLGATGKVEIQFVGATQTFVIGAGQIYGSFQGAKPQTGDNYGAD